MPQLETKAAEFAKLIDGQIVSNQVATEICIKGIVSGFPVKLEAIKGNYPFGVSYSVETGKFSSVVAHQNFKLVVTPKYAKGRMAAVTRFIFFERRGQKLDLPQLDSAFVFKYDNNILVKQFAQHENVGPNIQALEKQTHFNEMVIKSDAGIYLSQPEPFIALDLKECLNTFRTMTELAQVLFNFF
jgi:hypothetical protein